MMYCCTRLSEIGRHILPVGRSILDERGLSTDWSGAGFSVKVKADRAVIGLGGYNSETPSYLRVYIGGRPAFKQAVSTGNEKIVIEDLGGGECEITVVLASGHGGVVTFSEIELYGENAALCVAPKEKALKIEYIGDSLTCGYGALGGPHHKTYYAYEEDVTMAYAFMTSELLGASGRYTCISGQGIIKNCNGETGTPMPLFFRRTLKSGGEDYDHSSWVPDIVVVTAGTNDNGGGVSKPEFDLGCRAFNSQIRAAYPSAHIIWDYGICNDVYCDTLENMVKDISASDARVRYLRAVPMRSDEFGSNGHPDHHYHRRFADQLAGFIRETILK